MSGTTTTSNNPWATQQPYLATGFASAQNLLQNNTPQYYPNATVADPSAYRAPWLNAQWNLGAEGTAESAAISQQGMGLLGGGTANLMGAPQLNAMASAAPQPGPTAGGAQDLRGYGIMNDTVRDARSLPLPTAGGAADLAGTGMLAASGRTAAHMPMATAGGAQDLMGTRTLQQTARGDYLTQQNPYFQQMVDQSMQAARPGVDAAFASTGRLGSGAHANAFADAATRIAGQLGYQDYGRERQMQQQAAGTLGQMDLGAYGLAQQGRLSGLGLQQQAGQAINQSDLGAYGQAQQGRLAGIGLQQQGGQSIGQMDLGAYGLAENARQFDAGNARQAATTLTGVDLSGRSLGGNMAQYADADQFRRVGLMGDTEKYADAKNQQLIDADMQRWNYGQNAPWEALQRYMGVVGGKDWGGTGTSTTQRPQPNEWLQWASALSGLMR